MRFPALFTFMALLFGALLALSLPAGALPWLAAAGVAAWQAALVALIAARVMWFIAAALASLALSSAAATVHADAARQHAPIRAIAPPADARAGSGAPIWLEGILSDDASVADDGVTLRLRVDRVRMRRTDLALDGTVALFVAGAIDVDRAREWTRGRRVRAPAQLRRHARHLNDGVADAERAALRRGIALSGTVKSASLVEVLAPAGRFQEAMAAARRRIRDAVAASLGPDREGAAIVTAILIGDRAGLSTEVEQRMQRAGTYHVIAISGGNVALFATLAWAVSRLAFRSRRAAVMAAITIVATYGSLVGAGASVGRAVAAALLFLVATLLDHRTPPLNVIAMVGIIFLWWDPLALTDLGFLLSFSATAAILIAVPRWMASSGSARSPLLRVATGMLAATMAAEVALLPIQASAFHRLTVAGFVLNLVAIPAMAVAQMAGLVLVAADVAGFPMIRGASAWAAGAGAHALIDSALLVDLLPVLTWRVAAPPAWLIAVYAAPCVLLAWNRWPRVRTPASLAAAAAAAAIATSTAQPAPPRGWLQVTMLDVGQAEAILVRLPSGRGVVIDTAGRADRFDIGDRVVVPAVLARGVSRLAWLALSHADIDHAGGARAVITDLHPARVIEGIAPVLDPVRTAIADAARHAAVPFESVRAGGSSLLDGVLFRVLHPPPPDWERQKVRNDDSLVLEVVFGSVSVLLTGDAGEPVEPAIAAQLSPARLRILKVGHHGSRTSTSPPFLAAVRPVAALISAGRGNFYGHPAAPVIDRLRGIGAQIFRTDRDGEIDLLTDGRTVSIRTWTGRRWDVAARR